MLLLLCNLLGTAAQAGSTLDFTDPSDLTKAAKQLGLDAAPAMIGFDVHDGRPVPKFDGVVVCEEHAALLREAAAAIAEREEDQAAHKQTAEALDLWRTLLRALAIRRRLEVQYGRADS